MKAYEEALQWLHEQGYTFDSMKMAIRVVVFMFDKEPADIRADLDKLRFPEK
jgi:hypothetical protein